MLKKEKIATKLFLILIIVCQINCYQVNFSKDTEIANKQNLKDDPQLIISGVGTSVIHLGIDEASLLNALGKPKFRSPLFKDSDCGDYYYLVWYKSYPDGSVEEGEGLTVYLKNNIVYEIYFGNPNYRTEKGISYGSKLSDNVDKIGKESLKIMLNSSSEATNGENVLYSIDEENGIAYEFGKNSSQEIIVIGIYIFSKSDGFQRYGCSRNLKYEKFSF